MLKKIQKWLSDPKRDYAQGVKFFARFASETQKKNFSDFFKIEEGETVEQFDIRFTTLINQVLFVEKRIQANPDLFKESKLGVANSDSQTDTGVEKPETKVLNLNELPEELSAERDRLKELVPLMAKLHADMAEEKLADDKRAVIRAELVKLDDERRAIWQKIQTYGDGENLSVEKSPEETAVERNTMALGAEIALRIGQLKSYITRNENGLKKHLEAGNEKKAENSRQKIDEYSKELEELQALLPGDGE